METMPIFRAFENVSEGVILTKRPACQPSFATSSASELHLLVWLIPSCRNRNAPHLFFFHFLCSNLRDLFFYFSQLNHNPPCSQLQRWLCNQVHHLLSLETSQNIDCRVQMRLHQQYQWPVLFTHGRAFSFFGVRNFLPRNFSRDTNGIKYTILILTLVMMDDVAAQSITRFLLCKINCWFCRNQGCIGQTGRAPAQGMS